MLESPIARHSRSLIWSVLCLLTTAFLCLAGTARAQQSEAAATPDPVERKVNQLLDQAMSTNDQVQAEAQAVEIWDREMNRVYNLLLQRLPPAERAHLKDAQQKWIVFRDADKPVINDVYQRAEGSMYRPMAVGAVLELVKARTLQLRSYLDVAETAWPEKAGQ